MAMARVCDLCGKPVRAPFKQLKVLKVESEDTEPRNFKTIKSLDLHEKCYSGFAAWLKEVQDKSEQFKNVGPA